MAVDCWVVPFWRVVEVDIVGFQGVLDIGKVERARGGDFRDSGRFGVDV